MTELEFAGRHLGEYKIKGNEIVPRYCPFCQGGGHHDKETFALNMDNHTYNCLRGSCGASGHFSQLCKEFGEDYREWEPHTQKVKRRYKKPVIKDTGLSADALKYLEKRGLSEETAVCFGLKSGGGNMIFPYYRTMEDYAGGSATFVKYRKPKKLEPGERKMWREKDTEPILYGMHLCNMQGRLHIFEGEFDAMCGYQTGVRNCVSVPSGCEDYTWIDTCYGWLKRYPEIVVMADNDEAGLKMLGELAVKLDGNIMRPDFELYGGNKDANEILVRLGIGKLREIIESARTIEIEGLLNLAEVRNVNMDDLPRTLTGIQLLDRATGGMYMGDLSVWTGKRGEGKSTILTQVLVEAIKQCHSVCAYSGEMPAERFKYIVNLQAAGEGCTEERDDPLTGRRVQYVPRKYLDKIESWYNGKFWLYDNKSMDSDEAASVLRLFELSYKRYNCKVFLVDNLMTVATCRDDAKFLQMQADFTIKLRKLAERTGTHIHMVAHPRKGKVESSDSVGGLSEITNIACGVYSMQRISDDDRAEFGCDAVLTCLKNRAYGENVAVKLNYSPKCRRFTELGGEQVPIGWEQEPGDYAGLEEYNGEVPF